MNLGELQKVQIDARTLASDLGVTTRDLTDKELIRFGRSYERQFITVYPDRQVVDLYMRHKAEAILGAMIAKDQMNAEIDDEQPASNKIGGPNPIEAMHLGIGDDWEDLNSIYAGAQNAWTTGAPQAWIHSATTLMGGLIPNAIRIGQNAVHVVFGIETTHDSPRIEAVQFIIDGKQKPKMTTFWQPRTLPGAPHAVKELDNAFIFKKDTTVLALLFISGAFGAPSALQTDFPRLVGVSYIKEPTLRLLDPVTGVGRVLPGATHDVVYVT